MIASLIVALHLMGFATLQSAVISLYIAGALLLIAEIAVVSFGLIFFNGMIAFYAAYTLQNGGDPFFGAPVGWSILFGIAFVELFIIAAIISVHIWIRNHKTTTGAEGMVGAQAVVIDWDKTSGSVRIEGEIWKARSDKDMDLKEGDKVTVETVNKLDLTITV